MFIATLPPVSNRASWIESVELTDAETGDLIDLSAVDEIKVEVREQGEYGETRLSASKTGGDVVILELGVFQFTFTASEMSVLTQQAYDVGAIITDGDETAQLILGTVPVLDGIVRP